MKLCLDGYQQWLLLQPTYDPGDLDGQQSQVTSIQAPGLLGLFMVEEEDSKVLDSR